MSLSDPPYVIRVGDDGPNLVRVGLNPKRWPVEGVLACAFCGKGIARRGRRVGCYRWTLNEGIQYWHLKCAYGQFVDESVWDIGIPGRS